jgi:hypothetical protein
MKNAIARKTAYVHEEILRLRDQGYSLREIGVLCGISPATAMRHLHDAKRDSTPPLDERQSRLPQYLETLDRLAETQDRLFATWRRTGFVIVWSALIFLPSGGFHSYTSTTP